MGIKGLHGLLKSIQKPCHLKKFSGQTLGVDAYGWLHRGTVACAVDLVLDKPTTKHIDFVLNRVRMLLYFGVTPYLVFDGDDLPSKSGTESDRHQRRQQSKALGLELQRKGRMAEAYQEFQKAVDVTPYMARQLIEELKKMNVQYVVAPYEADAQLVYLERHGMIDGIISEDSDLLVFGAKRLLSKLDQHGDCIEINRADFTACREVSLIGWTDADFRRMCILSGCDYLPNIARLGLKTAYRCIRKYKNVEKALRMLQFEGQYRVPADYLDNFKQAELTFLYQRVFCPKAGKLVTLTPPEDVNLDELSYIGGDVDADIAVGVARGDLDPTTKEPIVLKPLAPSRPVLGIQRRQTLGSSAELKPKPNKPISTFFTPKRMPLAELDPNSLTPSPSQQRLLERYANSSWDSSPAPAGLNAARSAPSLRRSQTTRVSSPLARSAERSSFLAQASKASTFQPAKRQRLCAEAEEGPLPTLANCRSRFFVHKDGESSLSGQKSTKSEKARNSTIGVFSDDSAEDIMSELPDPTQPDGSASNEIDTPCKTADQREAGLVAPTPATPVALPADEGQKEEESFENAAVSETTIPEDTVPEPTPEKSVSADSDSETFHQVLNYHVERQNTSILSKFTFKPGDSPGVSRKSSLGAMNAQSPRTSPAGLLLGPRRSPARRQRSTPLQRLGQSALSRSRSMIVPGSKTVPPPPTFSTCSAANQHLAAPKIFSAQGSEDMIIPNSEDESEDDANDSGASQGPVSLDLKQFSFTGSGTD
ncbi:putative exonuclease [Aspergillus chevalieri]|uniref:Rad2 nuclease n=1 Tax=Aspergillus chevalieri TaxID=182096 RepID=A0A7R7VNC1_ASPCH|nr:Rad2 nuclease [Aspergillus chevalieri]BCR87853.1 Rad2 nuclease [Aspergillus chevalieri]